MVYSPTKTLSFDEFIAQYGDDSGGIAFIGKPKQPTFTVCQLTENGYTQQQFRLGETIISSLFPQLQLRLDDISPRQ